MRMFLKITDVEKKSKIRPLRTETKLTVVFMMKYSVSNEMKMKVGLMV